LGKRGLRVEISEVRRPGGKKLKKVGIIYPIRHSDWLSNPVVVRKKTREIQMCVDFRDLNKSSVKDNYPFPNMEFLLQQVTGSACMSMLDGFSGIIKSWLQRKTEKRQPS
jgi:hypothetical protein